MYLPSGPGNIPAEDTLAVENVPLTKVLDMDDDFRATTLPHNTPLHHPSLVISHQNSGFARYKLYIIRIIWIQ